MSDNQSLCLALLYANSEDEVIAILKEAGYWDNPDVWRLYGDRDGNFAVIGNQQSRPEAALVEKIINSVDARLMNECQVRGINPQSSDAPSSIRQAVWEYFEEHGEKPFDPEIGGSIQEWSRSRRTEESRRITIASTGKVSSTCLTVADLGEGQTPNRIPETFLSLERSNKLRIHFVQGQFNMGGTGVLNFCGTQGFQLVISKRNPAIVSAMGEDDSSSAEWGFTLVRRERPAVTNGGVKNSMFTYLAPLGAEEHPNRGGILRFTADSLPLMPDGNVAYSREVSHGSVLKLYEYDMKGFRGMMMRSDGLLYRLEPLLPDIALPIRLHECRDGYGGHSGSFDTPLAGLTVRLEKGKGGNVEDGFPDTVPFMVHGQKMVAKIYAFRPGKAERYRTNQGVLLTVNGQTHGHLPKSIFGRKSVKLGRLADSLLVTVDCSGLSVSAREDLFMTSRDRLRDGELGKAVNSEIEDILRHHDALKELANKRRNEEVSNRLKDSKPLENILQEVMKMSPALARLFQRGNRLSRPYMDSSTSGAAAGKTGSSTGNQGNSDTGGVNGNSGVFEGKPHPTYFRYRNKPNGTTLHRDCEIGRRARIKFETDVENGYFNRSSLKGHYDVEVLEGRFEGSMLNHNLTLHDGVANWNVEIPEGAVEGETLVLQCVVNDETLVEPFCNVATLTVKPKQEHGVGTNGKRDRTGSKSKDTQKGNQGGGAGGNGGGTGGNEPDGISMPDIDEVERDRWDQFGFDENSACKIIEDVGEDERSLYTFHVNVDNVCLETEMKYAKGDPAVLKAKFVYGNVLIGLALLQDHLKRPPTSEDQSEDWTIEGHVAGITRALAPFVIPMIDYLGSLESDDVIAGAESGDID
ncbi:hypothetical protein NG895_04195 [Aeoliella sp. ICT_H6.2]|uniref:Uncharacterized protein n=1 Tax=Aeoliella straminimaris TaxID=2954799 RepID=A0A9X2F6D1_9BACT|nr:hypothetical protein [Aeoliella straminimaris]MCO6043097.1 hypothetical protein [Aeoliella straminimaris]